MNLKYLSELEDCHLCPWNCGVNRLQGEKGVCQMGMPEIAYTSHSPVLKSYSITLLGCSFRCIYCNAYRLSQYPQSGWRYRGYIEPSLLLNEALEAIEDTFAQNIGIDRISFTGGEPSIHLPFLEKLVNSLQKANSELKVGIATNGFSTHRTLKRLCQISSQINFEIKAYEGDLHQAITGAPVDPILTNAEWLINNYPQKIRVFRTVIIPGINDAEIRKIAKFLYDLDPQIRYRLVGFRPHYLLYYHPGPTRQMMMKLVGKCKDIGLQNVDYSGFSPNGTSLQGFPLNGLDTSYKYLNHAGCYHQPRDCGNCPENENCPAVILEPWTNLP